MRRWALILSILILASTAHAAADNAWGTNVNGTNVGCEPSASVGSSGKICFDFNSALSPATTSFSVRGGSALACLRPDVATIGVKTAQAVIYYCPTGDPTSTTTCGIQAGATASVTLDGTNGVPSGQTTCVPLGPGVYFVSFTVLPAGAEVGLLTVQGGQ